MKYIRLLILVPILSTISCNTNNSGVPYGADNNPIYVNSYNDTVMLLGDVVTLTGNQTLTNKTLGNTTLGNALLITPNFSFGEWFNTEFALRNANNTGYANLVVNALSIKGGTFAAASSSMGFFSYPAYGSTIYITSKNGTDQNMVLKTENIGNTSTVNFVLPPKFSYSNNDSPLNMGVPYLWIPVLTPDNSTAYMPLYK